MRSTALAGCSRGWREGRQSERVRSWSIEQVRAVADAGGQMIISPNADLDVIAATVERGLVSLPGVFTPSEAFAALKAGATGLKLFPAEAASPAVLKAWRAVIPASVPVVPVGGVTPDNMAAKWLAAGASGFGFGSALDSAGLDAVTVAARAARFHFFV
jgi:2-dehydro-3-deoxyphosphogalactonate aldolase